MARGASRGALLRALLAACALCAPGAAHAQPDAAWRVAEPDAARAQLLPSPAGLARLASYDQVRAPRPAQRRRSSAAC